MLKSVFEATIINNMKGTNMDRQKLYPTMEELLKTKYKFVCLAFIKNIWWFKNKELYNVEVTDKRNFSIIRFYFYCQLDTTVSQPLQIERVLI